MSQQYLDRVQQAQPAPVPLVMPFTREGREMARNDRQAVVRARADYNQARLQMHRIMLSTMLERAEADQRAQLAEYAMFKVREVDDIANQLCTMNRPALEMTIREIQNAFNCGEVARIIRRGVEG